MELSFIRLPPESTSLFACNKRLVQSSRKYLFSTYYSQVNYKIYFFQHLLSQKVMGVEFQLYTRSSRPMQVAHLELVHSFSQLGQNAAINTLHLLQ